MSISLEKIQEECNFKTYVKGNVLFLKDGVFDFTASDNFGSIVRVEAVVNGSNDNEYKVTFEYDELINKIVDYECTCPAYYVYEGMCKHCVAVALKYKEISGVNQQNKDKITSNKLSTTPVISQLIYSYSMKDNARYFQPRDIGRVELEPTLHHRFTGWTIDFRIGTSQKYVLKDINAFLHSIDKGEKVIYGKKLGFIHEISAFEPKTREIINFLKKYVEEKAFYENKGYYAAYKYNRQVIRELELSPEGLVGFFNILVGSGCLINEDYSNEGYINVIEKNPEFSIILEKNEDGGFEMIMPVMESIYGDNQLFIKIKDIIYKCSKEFTNEMYDVCKIASEKKEVVLNIEEKDMNAFCSVVYPVIKKNSFVETQEEIDVFMPLDVKIKIYIEYKNQNIICRIEAEYGEDIFNVLEAYNIKDMYRDIAKESIALHTAAKYFVTDETKNYLYIEENNEDGIYYLLSIGIEQLNMVGEVYVSDEIRKMQISKSPKVTMGISVNGGLLDLKIESDSLPYDELEGLLSSYRRRKKYYRLKNGDFIQLEENSLSTVSEIVDGLDIDENDLQNGSIKVPRFRAFYLDQILREDNYGIEVSREQTFKSMIRSMKNVEDSDYEVPEELLHVLRNYQKTGYRWLCTLDAMGFGGILADDMGLGKTIQVITLLRAKQIQWADSKKRTSIIICPASLIFNWESEIEKFAPDLNALVVAGSVQNRKELLQSYKEYDVVITSYDLLKRDIEEYQDKEFYYEIIDEAQNIKNHRTSAAKAVKKVVSTVRFALTGTPIENRLSELWSIFDFVMPGIFGKYKSFREDYELAIVQNKDEIITKRFQKMIRPFILRRLKKDVLKDLPDKIENVVYSKLEGEQLALYSANVQQLLDKLNKKTPKEFSKGKIQILAELTRLRQICCDPALIYDDYKGEAAKLDTCMELIRNAVEGENKVLLFSQFTSMISIIEKKLKHEKISFCTLTGSTSKEMRAKLVEDFNDNEISVFLISLKAGGTGLNLTSASIVIHFDPWWNIAAQNQATDRAHRIGQTNSVAVFKLIAKHTIEEKILKLQEIKKELSDQIISEEGVSASNLTQEDFMSLLE